MVWRFEYAAGWHDTHTNRGLAALRRDQRDEPEIPLIPGLVPCDLVTSAQAQKLSGMVPGVAMDWVKEHA